MVSRVTLVNRWRLSSKGLAGVVADRRVVIALGGCEYQNPDVSRVKACLVDSLVGFARPFSVFAAVALRATAAFVFGSGLRFGAG